MPLNICAEKKGPQVQSKSSDPNSGNVDTDTIAGVQQADKVCQR